MPDARTAQRDLVGSSVLSGWTAPRHRARAESAVSRLIQVMLCLGGLIVLSPVLLLVALAVRLSSPGPVFYRGERVGKDERIFHIFKFRTLVTGAETRIGARLLNEGDQLYTPIGKFLKKWKLDEFPQLLNVVNGDMSLVGPRPVRPVFLETLKGEIRDYASRFQVRPGITGLAQLRGGYWTEPRNKLRYELVYIRNRSLLMDVKLIVLTFLKIFNRFVTTGAVFAVVFLFASFVPNSMYSWLNVMISGVRFNVLYLLILAFGAWMAVKSTYANRLFVYRSPIHLPMAAFAAAGFGSAVFTPDPEDAVRRTAYYVVTGFFVALSLLNTRLTSSFARSAATLVGLACGVLSLVGLVEVVLINQSLLSNPAGAELPGRVIIKATFASANVLSVYLVLGFPLLLCQLIHARTRDGRDFWLVATTIALTTILLTQSLPGMVALFVACVVFLTCTSVRAVPLLTGVFVVPVLLLGMWDQPAPVRAYHALRVKFGEEIRLLTSAPVHKMLMGRGPEVQRTRVPEPAPKAAPAAPAPSTPSSSNMHLALILERGILGWLLMLWIIAAALGVVYQGARRAVEPYQRSLLWAIFSSVLGFLISMNWFDVFLHLPLQILFWGLLGLGLGVVTHAMGRRSPFYTIWRFGDERPRPERRSSPPHHETPPPSVAA
jgi:lipopolysaccharide/colanic/teichoic acid biosynthesis glycosyltransferase